MTALKPGDVVTDEPTVPGTVVRDQSDDLWDSRSGRWRHGSLNYTWSALRDRFGPITLVCTPEPAPAPAGDAAAELEALAAWLNGSRNATSDPDVRHGLQIARAEAARRAAHLRAAAPAPAEWGTITAADVQVGDHIEVTRRKGSGAIIVYTGTVSSYDGPRRVFLAEDLCIDIHLPDQTIRRRVRQQMREPEAPAVVRHAGLIWARRIDSVQWFGLDNHDGGRLWREVLALDPATDPVAVDLGGGE